MKAIRTFAAFILAVISSGIVSAELQTEWVNPGISFWAGRGMGWIAQMTVSTAILAIAVLSFRFFPIGRSVMWHVVVGALANGFLLICFAIADQDALLLSPSEIINALLYGALAGLIWFLIKHFIKPRGDLRHA